MTPQASVIVIFALDYASNCLIHDNIESTGGNVRNFICRIKILLHHECFLVSDKCDVHIGSFRKLHP